MTIAGIPILSLIIFFPLAGVGLLLFVDRAAEGLVKWITLVVSGATFLISLALYWGFESGEAGFQFVERVPWIASWGVKYMGNSITSQ